MTFVLLLLAAALWWLSRRNKGFLLPANQRRIQILEAYPMGLRHKLLLVQVDQQCLLLSVTNSEIQTLHAWRADTSSSTEPGVNDAN
ncbi:MAG: flagellar biosynthetic protein FliO [Limnohabitans sp.]